jgi:hypothetical protein
MPAMADVLVKKVEGKSTRPLPLFEEIGDGVNDWPALQDPCSQLSPFPQCSLQTCATNSFAGGPPDETTCL